ncbi:MAG: large-conductance mechanosensitive channel protein MscL [Paludibacteraceae bacterium]|nr:large-conductance mechanosensitive channel protein MscL [Candidatus Physcocola equi]MCQ2234606.1 large-conductance mechanosensitive channel protein MscL [Paludibacteraceae bacterium]
MKLLDEFKTFAMKGNVVDMAVGVIIGGAFGKIVTSLVNDLIMPLVGMACGGVDFTKLSYKLAEGEDGAVLNYGQFLQNVFDFLIIAICIFFFIKLINAFNKKKEEAPAAPPAPSKEEVLLTEIRDLLKNK